MTHTPLSVDDQPLTGVITGLRLYEVSRPDEFNWYALTQSREAAEEIRVCVNSRAALVEALREARKDMATLVRAYMRDENPEASEERLNEIAENWSSIRPIDAALALVGEQLSNP